MKKIQIFLKGKNKTNDVIKYERNGYCYKITFKNGKTYNYKTSDVRIIEPSKEEKFVDSKLDYFREIADKVGLPWTASDGKTHNILAQNYKKISSVLPETMLYNFLKGELSEKPPAKKDIFGAFFRLIKSTPSEDEKFIIYPFGFNISQKEALEKALDSNLSIIEGPPGTGKTQTILNILANIVMRKESVAVVSSNNSATKNIIDKLKKYEVDFIAAYLGNMENKQDFINTQSSLPDMSDWLIDKEEIVKLKSDLKTRYNNLQEKLEKQNELSILKQNLSELETENTHHLKYLESFNIPQAPYELNDVKSSENALEMSFLCEITEQNYFVKTTLFKIIKAILKFFGFNIFKKSTIEDLLASYSKDYLIALYQQKFYDFEIKSLNQKIDNIENDLLRFDFDRKMREYSELSAEIFKSKLSEKYENQKREVYLLDDLQHKSKDFINNYPIILSTTYSLRNSLSSDFMYDYVIVDEASQVDLCTGALAFSCAKNAVIVGDLKQLPNVVDDKKSKLTDEIFQKYDLPEVYRYKNHCLLSTVSELFKNAPRTLLREHYRCNPKIIEFCNKKFYNNELIILSKNDTDKKPMIVYRTVEGNHARERVNQRQIDVIKNEIIPNENLFIDDNSLGIVTPYRNQTSALQKAFSGTGIKADTVDKFQGQENKVIILSTVDNHISEFTDNPNRLNVAISRAIEQLIVVVNGNEDDEDTNISELVKYIDYNNFDIRQSKIYSVFDLLYKSYAKKRQDFFKKHKKISDYDSENIMYVLIKKALKKYDGHFDVAIHVPVKTIIRDTSLMTSREKEYATNSWTHVDFLIYNTIDKSPLIAIEVDGAKYHKIGTKQYERDKIKNTIFNKYHLTLERFNTMESGEKERLNNLLKSLLK